MYCGEEGTRTPRLLLAKQALYQMSYFPSAIQALAQPDHLGTCHEPVIRSAGTWIRTKDLSFIRAAL